MHRRRARELALQALFQVDIGRQPLQQALEWTLASEPPDSPAREFTRLLVRGVAEHGKEIDSHLSRLARDWSLQRMPSVDRNLLRMAAFELLFVEDVPVSVTINEAVELAKQYSTADSGRFVNGVLGSLARSLGGEVPQERPAADKE